MPTVTISHAQQVVRMTKSGTIDHLEIPYNVEGIVSLEDGEVEALTAVKNAAPSTRNGLPFSYVEIESRESDTFYRVKAVYEKSSSSGSSSASGKKSQYGEAETVSFDCGGGTQHIEKSIKQTQIIGDMDAHGMINWNGKSGADMDVRGLDLPTADIRESYIVQIPRSKLKQRVYRRQLASLVGKVNAAMFKGWERGEVMFLGCTYSHSIDMDKEAFIPVTFNFSIRMNETGVEIGDVKVDKKGFEYIWSIGDTKINRETGKMETVISNAYLEQVVEYANFGLLNIDTRC